MPEIKVIESPELSTPYDKRYVVIDKETGAVLDDAQGYGYKSAQKAHAAYSYKTRDKSKDAEKLARKRHIIKWLKENKAFASLLEDAEWYSVKEADEQVDAAFVKKLLKENNLEPDFTAGELLRVWRSKWK